MFISLLEVLFQFAVFIGFLLKNTCSSERKGIRKQLNGSGDLLESRTSYVRMAFRFPNKNIVIYY